MTRPLFFSKRLGGYFFFHFRTSSTSLRKRGSFSACGLSSSSVSLVLLQPRERVVLPLASPVMAIERLADHARAAAERSVSKGPCAGNSKSRGVVSPTVETRGQPAR